MFNVETIQQSRSFETLKAGLYLLTIDSVFLKPTASNGQYFEVVLRADNGAKIWHRMTYTSRSDTAIQIGRQQLADLCHAIGIKNSQGKIGFDSVEDFQAKGIGKNALCDVFIEIYNGRESPKIATVWSIEGKHRNEVRNLKEIKLGPNGKPPVLSRNSAPIKTTNTDEDLPF